MRLPGTHGEHLAGAERLLAVVEDEGAPAAHDDALVGVGMGVVRRRRLRRDVEHLELDLFDAFQVPDRHPRCLHVGGGDRVEAAGAGDDLRDERLPGVGGRHVDGLRRVREHGGRDLRLHLGGDEPAHERDDVGGEQRVARHVVDAERRPSAQHDVGEPDALELRAQHTLRERPGDAAGPGRAAREHLGRQVLVDDEVGDAQPSPGLKDPRDLRERAGLAGREVQHPVGDHHVDGRVVEGERLHLTRPELAALGHARLLGRGARPVAHLRQHVEADHPPVGAHPQGREHRVDPAAAADVEDDLALGKLRVPHRVTDPERPRDRPLGHGGELVGAVEPLGHGAPAACVDARVRGADDVADLVLEHEVPVCVHGPPLRWRPDTKDGFPVAVIAHLRQGLEAARTTAAGRIGGGLWHAR